MWIDLASTTGDAHMTCECRPLTSWRCGPLPSEYERVAIPDVVEFVQLAEISGRIYGLAELADADRCNRSNHCCVGLLFCDLNGACERPSAPVEADNHRHDSARGCALQETFERVSPQK